MNQAVAADGGFAGMKCVRRPAAHPDVKQSLVCSTSFCFNSGEELDMSSQWFD